MQRSKSSIFLWDDTKSLDEFVNDISEGLLIKCLDAIYKDGKVSIVILQKELQLGFNSASRIMDLFEEKGIISKKNANNTRDLLLTYEEALDKILSE